MAFAEANLRVINWHNSFM